MLEKFDKILRATPVALNLFEIVQFVAQVFVYYICYKYSKAANQIKFMSAPPFSNSIDNSNDSSLEYPRRSQILNDQSVLHYITRESKSSVDTDMAQTILHMFTDEPVENWYE